MLASVRTKEELETLGEEVYKLMCKYSLPLQIRYATSKEAHPDWQADVPQETLLGYQWNKETDEIIPQVDLTCDNKGKGIRADLIKDKPFTIRDITKR